MESNQSLDLWHKYVTQTATSGSRHLRCGPTVRTAFNSHSPVAGVGGEKSSGLL